MSTVYMYVLFLHTALRFAHYNTFTKGTLKMLFKASLLTVKQKVSLLSNVSLGTVLLNYNFIVTGVVPREIYSSSPLHVCVEHIIS